jgi:O-antigen/teichoic acid export membrane protein
MTVPDTRIVDGHEPCQTGQGRVTIPEFGLDTSMIGRNSYQSRTIRARLSRLSHSSLALYTLKGLNSALTATTNLVLAFVLVRTIGLDSYAVIASLLAIAALVVQTDLGITGLIFFKLRSHYLGETGKHRASRDDQDLAVAIVTVYIAIGVVSSATLGIALASGLVQVAAYGTAYLLIFSAAVCALPRMALRVAINARDGFFWTEAVELGRRIALLAIAVAMLVGLSLVSYGALSLSVWVLSIAAMIWLAHSYGFAPRRGALRRGLRLLRDEIRGVRATVLLSLADFIISIFPYYLLAATRDAAAIVSFDMFYKVTRFAVMCYLIGAETVLPRQTRAVHNQDATGFTRATAKGFMAGLLPMSSGIVAIALFGEEIFGVILNHGGIVSPVMRVTICVMLIFMLIQTTCQIVLIGVGRFEELARRSCITLAGMVLISTLMVLFHWSVDAFVVAYVTVYGAGSLLYAECLYSLKRSLCSKSARETFQENPQGTV